MIHLSKTVVGALAASMLAAPAMAEERRVPADLILTEAMVPYVFQYAACVFGGPGANADERIAGCSETKGRLQAEAKQPFSFWHRGKGPTRNRQFARAFNLLESEARILENYYGPVPSSVTGYMECVGRNVAASDAFKNGRTINYVDFNVPCRAEASLSLQSASDLEVSLYQRVRRTGRVNRVPLNRMISHELDRGLLGARYF